MVTITVMIGAPTGTCLLAAASERDAAAMAERALLAIAPAALPVPLWFQCAEDGARNRLNRYFADLQTELAALARLPEPTPDPD